MSEGPARPSESMVERIGRSWRGALLDIVLIVGSILIAFALDAWWDGRLRADQEREALAALAEELRGSRVELDSVIAFNERRRDGAALGSSLEGLLFELREVELRLDALQAAVATELGVPVPG